jgi:hypothetical protein
VTCLGTATLALVLLVSAQDSSLTSAFEPWPGEKSLSAAASEDAQVTTQPVAPPRIRRRSRMADGGDAEVARRVPGYAGFYIGADKTPVMLLVDETKAQEARDEATRVLGFDMSTARVERAKYDFLQLMSWKESFRSSRCLPSPNVIGTAVQKNELFIRVRSKADVETAQSCAAKVGVPRDALRVEVGPVRPDVAEMCSATGHEPRAGQKPATAGPALQTEHDVYKAGDARDILALDIGLHYTNRTARPRYLTGCWGPEPPVMEKLVEGRWVAAYGPVSFACRGPDITIEPGATCDYEYKVRAARKGQWVPSLRVDEVPGTYRIRWRIFDTLERLDHPPWLGHLVPEQESISNTFRIE